MADLPDDLERLQAIAASLRHRLSRVEARIGRILGAAQGIDGPRRGPVADGSQKPNDAAAIPRAKAGSNHGQGQPDNDEFPRLGVGSAEKAVREVGSWGLPTNGSPAAGNPLEDLALLIQLCDRMADEGSGSMYHPDTLAQRNAVVRRLRDFISAAAGVDLPDGAKR